MELARDKGKIAILPASNTDGVIDIGCLDIAVSQTFKIQINNNNERPVRFGYIVLGSSSDFELGSSDYKLMDENVANELRAVESIAIEVTMKANNPGIFNMTLAFWFRLGNDRPFTIVKYIKMELSDSVVNELRPTIPYVKPKLVPRKRGRVIKGVAPLK